MIFFFNYGRKKFLRAFGALLVIIVACAVIEMYTSGAYSKLFTAYAIGAGSGKHLYETINFTDQLSSMNFSNVLSATVANGDKNVDNSDTSNIEAISEGNDRYTGMVESLRINTLSPIALEKVKSITMDLNVSDSDTFYPDEKIGEYTFVNVNLCKGVDVIDFIIIVHTAPDHMDRRQRIRQTFANESLFLPFHVRVAFLLGRPKKKLLEKSLLDEHQNHNDTVMGDFLDDYHNLTLKGVMGYRFISQHCSNSRFVLKIDDDVMVNTFKLLYSFYGHMIGKSKSIFCNHWNKNGMSILREGKWKVDSHIFPKHKNFPFDYCSGFVVIITTDLIAPMYQAAKITPFFWIDDLYLFGMLPYVVGGMTFHDYTLERNLTLNQGMAMTCVRTQGIQCPILASSISSDSFWQYWDLIKENYQPGNWHIESHFVA